MNMQHGLIQEFMFYKFELGHIFMETIKNICGAKGENTVDHSTVIRWFKKFYSDCKKLNSTKTMNSRAILQARSKSRGKL